MVRFFAVLLLVTFCTTANAQLFSTKTGVISFFSSTPLEDIQAKSNDVESKLLSTTGQVTFLMLIKSFRFPNQEMEEHANESYFESDKFPKADFKGVITNISSINFAKDGSYPATVKGNLTIHGITKELTANGTITIKGGKPAVKSKLPIKVTDFGISGKIVGKELAHTIDITIDCKYD